MRGARVLHVNATPYGGGVSELLRCVVPLLNDLGLVQTLWAGFVPLALAFVVRFLERGKRLQLLGAVVCYVTRRITGSMLGAAAATIALVALPPVADRSGFVPM